LSIQKLSNLPLIGELTSSIAIETLGGLSSTIALDYIMKNYIATPLGITSSNEPEGQILVGGMDMLGWISFIILLGLAYFTKGRIRNALIIGSIASAFSRIYGWYVLHPPV